MLISKNTGTEIIRCEQCMKPVNTYITFRKGNFIYHVCNEECLKLLLESIKKTKKEQSWKQQLPY